MVIRVSVLMLFMCIDYVLRGWLSRQFDLAGWPFLVKGFNPSTRLGRDGVKTVL